MRRALMAMAMALTGAAALAQASLLADGEDWDRLSHPARPDAVFRFEAPQTLRIAGDAALGFVFRDAPPALRRLSWRWRVDAAPATVRHDLRGGDDRAVALHLWFDDGADAADQRFGPMARLLGYPRVTHALTYVWGGPDAAETVIVSPYHDRGRLMVLRGDAALTGVWLAEDRDVAADVARAFGQDAPMTPPRYIAISTDGDDTQATTAASVAELTGD